MQYIHPWTSEEYRESARAVRKIARECIQVRLRDLKNGETFPQDILASILDLSGINYTRELIIFVWIIINYYVEE